MMMMLEGGPKLTYTQKFTRLCYRMQDVQWRKYAAAVALGKLLGFVLLMAVILAFTVLPALLSGTAHAQQAVVTPAPSAVMPADLQDVSKLPVVNAVNTMWTLVAAFLVFGMQVGFTMLEAGFCRSRETVNVLVECVFDTCLCGFLFYAFGYAFMFGQGNGLIGWHDPADSGSVHNNWFFLQNIGPTTLYLSTGVPVLAHWVFQFAFADCASTICSGTMIGRTGFIGDILYSVCVSGFIYPILGHWVWGPDGWLYTMGGQNPVSESFTHFLPSIGYYFHDFAGSTVVHSIGGWIALAGGIVLGPRLGRKFKRDGGAPMLPHDLTIAICGGLLLWFGWYGFNPGSTLSAMDIGGIGRVAANTTLAACTGGLAAVILMYFRVGKWDAGGITNGFLAGLVAITCPCYWVTPSGACALGAVAGVIVILGVDLLEYLRIDDPIGAWPVHGLCGIWGTISLGFFACGRYAIGGSAATQPNPALLDPSQCLTGLFYGDHNWHLLMAQCIGSFVICSATFIIAMIMFAALHKAGVLRISKAGELEGMDIHEHGISAYPEYVISPLAAPAGMPRDTVGYMPPEARRDIPKAPVTPPPPSTVRKI